MGVGPLLPVGSRARDDALPRPLSLGYSGIRLETLQLLYDMLNSGVHAVVPEQGSVGSSGDLAPPSHLALAMIGAGDTEGRAALYTLPRLCVARGSLRQSSRQRGAGDHQRHEPYVGPAVAGYSRCRNAVLHGGCGRGDDP